MRDQIIGMQSYLAEQGAKVNRRPDVVRAVSDLHKARSSLERLMLELDRERQQKRS